VISKRFLSRYSMFELILIAMMACLGIATKPLIVPLVHIITGPLYIPGGAVAGGFYMLWIVLAYALIQKPGTSFLTAGVQAVTIMSLGFFGTHGAMSFFTYLIPGIAVELVFGFPRHRGCCAGCCFAAGIAANISGTFLVNLIFFRLPLIPLLLVLSSASLSGGLGGLIAYGAAREFRGKDFGVPLL